MNVYPKILTTLLFCSFLIFSGCAEKETPKKVSLNKKVPETIRKIGEVEKNTLYFGFDLRLGPKEDVKIYSSFLRYLENTTGYRFRIRFSERYEDTVDNLRNGITHFAAIGPLSFVIGRERNGIKCMVSGLNEKKKPEYHAVIFTRPGSKIENVGDLKGKTFAFGARYSTQGHLIPRKMLEDAGITLKELRHYVFTGFHSNTVRAVLNGEFDAGGMQDYLAKSLEREGKIKIIKISEPFPSSLICYNTTVDRNIVETVRSALLYLYPTGNHKDVLVNWDKTEMPEGFTPVNESDYEVIRALAGKYGLLGNEAKD
ncbi:MAG TPA: phosphate/phosphite/phosphonate ABC transporter substrate-binding protein [Nitrospirae bacterium]|nr:phosphate/phosphite/phosphonate ABC transporter substrate-binding protein [Nitrospirota bacterium]